MHLSFKDVFLSHNGSTSDKWINYLDVYELHLNQYIGKGINFLEIGIQKGGCIDIMSKYLLNAKIFGIDINPSVLSLDLENDAFIMCFDAANHSEIEVYLSGKSFDVIIDDGSHQNDDIISSFQALFPKLAPNGTYILEDIQTSYWPKYRGGGLYNANSAISFFKNMVDLINFFHIDLEPDDLSAFIDQKELYVKWIDYIAFHDNMIIIKKSKEPKLKAYHRFITGDPEKVEELGIVGTSERYVRGTSKKYVVKYKKSQD